MSTVKPKERTWHDLILASAGSGKTFTIATRFIQLLVDGAPVEQILASTFTRKAAGEIAERILKMLAAACVKDSDRKQIADHIKRPLTKTRCLELLGQLVGQLHRMGIGTLDSFFVKVVGSFALELNLPAEWRIVDEVLDEQMRSEAVHAMLREADPQALVTLIRRIDRGSASLSVHERLMSLVSGYYNTYRHTMLSGEQAAHAAWHQLKDPGPASSDDPAIHAAMEKLATVEVPRTAKGEEDKLWKNALADLQHCARTGDWFGLIENRIVSAVVRDGEAARYNRRPVPSDAADAVHALMDVARGRLVHALASQTDAIWQIMRLYDREYRRLQRLHRAYRFDDVTMALAGEGGEEALASRMDIYYRLDARVGHLLLDEFQDTSLVQWESLKPVVDEVMANRHERAALIVADPKQSIYGWRGGEPSLVRAVEQEYGLDESTLRKSWRSSQEVLDVVNDVFGELESNAVFSEPYDRATAATWRENFSQHIAAKDLPGYMRIAVSQDADSQLRRAAEIVKEVAEAAPGCDVGVLVSTNRAVAEIIDVLRRELHVQASEEGGNPLTDSPPVVAVLSLLKMADHPGDLVSRFHVATSPLGQALSFTDWSNDRAARLLAHEVRRSLLVHGYGPTLHRWTQQLASSCDSRDLGRMLQLVQLGCTYEAQATVRPGGFVQMVESTKVEDPSSARVRVMTVHQSKGLEFDIVVLAELDRTMGACSASDMMVYREEPTGPMRAVLPYVGEHVRMALPALQPIWEQHRARSLTDDLGVLYVAMTRARYALHAVIKPTSDSEQKEGPSLCAASLLRCALGGGAAAAPGDDAYFTHGDEDWYAKLPDELKVIEEVREETLPRGLLAKGGTRRRILPRKSPSSIEGGSKVDIGLLMRLETAAARQRGSAIHAACELIEWADQPIDRAKLEQVLPPEEIEPFEKMLVTPTIRATLLRSAYPKRATLSVLREESFVVEIEGTLLSGTFDRLVLVSEGARVVAAEVIDFKTDRVSTEAEVDQRVGFYTPQIEAYKRAASVMYDLPAEAVTAKLLFVSAGIVRVI